LKLAFVAVLSVLASAAHAQSVRVLYDFERGFEGWQLSGECFGRGPEDANYAFGRFSGWRGGRYASTAHSQRGGTIDGSVGRALSETFVIDADSLQFLIGGGRNDGSCELRLLVDGEAVRAQSGNGSDQLTPVAWDVSELRGKEARLELVDERRAGPRGYLLVDQIELVSPEALVPDPEPEPTKKNGPIMTVEGKLPLPPSSSLLPNRSRPANAPLAAPVVNLPVVTPGFFESPISVQLPDGTKTSAKRCIQLEATGYSPDPSENGGLTISSRGTPLGRGIAAVDPKVIPLGSHLWVEGYGYALADDVGSAIKGKRIDLCHATLTEGNAYGRKKVKVWILDSLPSEFLSGDRK
jgi:3D (Asp-Asp-Asp) domain-containing protein